MPRVSGLGWAELDWTSPPLRQETDAVNTLLEREERRVTAAGDKLVEGERQGADMICSRRHHILKKPPQLVVRCKPFTSSKRPRALCVPVEALRRACV